MSNLPKNIYPSIKAFKGADYTLRLQMFEGFTPPDTIVTEVWDRNKFKYNIPSTYDAEANKIEVTWTAEQLQKMGAINEFYIRFDNEGQSSFYRFGGEIKPSYNSSDIESTGYSVTAEYYVIEVLGIDLVKDQVGAATTAAATSVTNAGLTAADRVQTGLDRIATEEGAAQVALDKAATDLNVQQTNEDVAEIVVLKSDLNVIRTDTNTYKQQAETFKNQASGSAATAVTSAQNAAQSESNAASYAQGLKPASPTDTPSGTVPIYVANSAGTYTNFGGIVVSSGDLSSGLVQLRQISGVWTKVVVPINLAPYALNTSVNSQRGVTDNLKGFTASEIATPAEISYINSGTISSCTVQGATQDILRTLGMPLIAGYMKTVSYWAVRAGDIKFLILSKIGTEQYVVSSVFTHTATLGLNTLSPDVYTGTDGLLAWYTAVGTTGGIIGSKSSPGTPYSTYIGDPVLGGTYTLTPLTGNAFGITCTVVAGKLKSDVDKLSLFATDVNNQLGQSVVQISPMADISTATTTSGAGTTRMIGDTLPAGVFTQVDIFGRVAGTITVFILTKNSGSGTYNVVFSKDVVIAIGANTILIPERFQVAANSYLALYHETGQGAEGYITQPGTPYYTFVGKAAGSNITFTSQVNNALAVKAYIFTGFQVTADVDKLKSLIHLSKPSTGYVNFQVPVNCAVANVTSETLSTQDSESIHMDWGILHLPANYTPVGEPVKLIIGCHGTGTWIRENTNSQIAHAFWTAMGYALLDMNGMPASFDNPSWDSGNPNYADNGNRHYGAPFALQSYLKGYQYVTKNYNIAKDGCFVYGISMGGLASNMIVQSGSIPVIAQAGFAPCLDQFKQAYVDPWDAGTIQRAKIALYHGFEGTAPTYSNTKPAPLAERTYYLSNIRKVLGYNPMLKNVPMSGNDPANNIYKTIPANTTALQPTEELDYNPFSRMHPVPVKLWHNLTDPTVKYRYSKYYIDMAKRSGSLAELRTFPTGPGGTDHHNAWLNGAVVTGIPTITGGTTSIEASMYECMLWFKRFGNV